MDRTTDLMERDRIKNLAEKNCSNEAGNMAEDSENVEGTGGKPSGKAAVILTGEDIQELTQLKQLLETIPTGTLDEEKRALLIHGIQDTLRRLQATPRSDWHAAFESLLRIDLHEHADQIRIEAEHRLGVEPMRTDFLVLVEDGEVDLGRSIYRHFRKHNIIEYKSPDDSLNEMTLYKAFGYACAYISLAEHKSDIPPDEVTVTIFRHRLGSKMKKRFTKVEDGIYRVDGFPLSFYAVETRKLKGPEYAWYRVLSDRATEEDLEEVIRSQEGIREPSLREYCRVFYRLVTSKNAELMKTIRRNWGMEAENQRVLNELVYEFFKDEIDQKVMEEKAKREEAEAKSVEAEKAIQHLNEQIQALTSHLRERGYSAADIAGVLNNPV